MWVGEMGIDLSKSYAVAWTDRALDVDFLRHLARHFVVSTPPGVPGGHSDGMHGALTIDVTQDHADVPVVVSWPASS